MDEQLRPTAEAIEAALSAYEPMKEGSDGELSEDTQTFINVFFQNERLVAEFVGITSAIGCPEGADPRDWQGLAKAGHVNAGLMQKVAMLCDMFFWVGWHSRGAVEDSAALRNMVGE